MLLKKKDKIIKNLHGVPVCNVTQKKFLLPFSYQQQNILLKYLDLGHPISSVAYTNIPPDYMDCALHYSFVEEASYSKYYKKIDEASIWKIVNSGLSFKQMKWSIYAACYGVYIVDEIEHPSRYGDDMFHAIALCAEYGRNPCKKVKPHMDQTGFINECFNFYAKKSLCGPSKLESLKEMAWGE